jgi:hypothetical protein
LNPSHGGLPGMPSKPSVAQVSKPAVSPTSKSAAPVVTPTAAGLETRDTANLEVRATAGRRDPCPARGVPSGVNQQGQKCSAKPPGSHGRFSFWTGPRTPLTIHFNSQISFGARPRGRATTVTESATDRTRCSSRDQS